MTDILEFIPLGLQLVLYLCYIAIVIHFIHQPNNEARFKFIFIVLGFFSIFYFATGKFTSFLYNPEWSFMLTQMAIMLFLSFMGVHMLIDRNAVLILVILFLITITSKIFLAVFLGWIAYIIVIFGFIYSAYKKIAEKQVWA